MVSDWAKRWMIAECCAFVESSDQGCERWRAHRDWAQSLDGDSSVITFNYDLAFELLRPEHNLCLPGEPASQIDQTFTSSTEALTGSVAKTASMKGSRQVLSIQTNNAKRARSCNARSEQAGPLQGAQRPLDKAMDAIRSAELIVFVGYRFHRRMSTPETKFSKRFLRAAKTKNSVLF